MIERYTRPEMCAIWEPHNRFAKWLEVEVLVCEAMAQEGMIPQKSLDTIKEKADFSIDRIQEIEDEVKHDMIAFLTNVEEYVGPKPTASAISFILLPDQEILFPYLCLACASSHLSRISCTLSLLTSPRMNPQFGSSNSL